MNKKRAVLQLGVILILLVSWFGATLPSPARANVDITQTFMDASVTDWKFLGDAKLTAAPGVNIDPAGSGWLRLTENTGNQAGTAIYNVPFASYDGIQVEFQYASYGTTNGADGISFYLIDGATTNPTAGGYGAGLGYGIHVTTQPASNTSNTPGVTNGYVGVGLDEYGNFATNQAGNCNPSCPTRVAQVVDIRSSGSLWTGFNYLTRSSLPTDSGGVARTIDSVTRTNARWVRITVVDNKIKVEMMFNGVYTPVFTGPGYTDGFYDLKGKPGMVAMPATFKMAFAGSTGSMMNTHEIRNLTVKSVKTSSITTLTTSNPAVQQGTSLTYTARVESFTGAGIPTGTVTFFDGATQIGTPVALTPMSGYAQATLTTSALLGGLRNITAQYSGDTYFGQSTDSVTQDISPLVTVAKAGSGSGAVTSDTGGINCGSTCSAIYATGASFNLTAVADPGSVFTGWSGDVSSASGTVAVTANTTKNITANFARFYAVNISKAGSGSGIVTGNVGGINCGSTCSANIQSGTSLTLTAVANAGSVFTGWSGDVTGSANALTLTVDSARNITANFAPTAPVTVSRAGAGSGTVTSNAGGINCGTACSADIQTGTSVNLTASPDANSTFAGWSGDLSGATSPASLLVDGAKNVTATFNIKTYTITIAAPTNGTVTSDPAGISCPGTCSATFNSGMFVTLTAAQSAGYVFTGWSDGSGLFDTTPTITVQMGSNLSYTAGFAPATSVVAFTNTRTPTGSPISVGTNVTYSLYVKNNTNGTINNLNIVDFVPDGTTYGTYNANGGTATYDSSTGKLTFTRTNLAKNNTWTPTFTVQVADSGAGAKVNNTARMTFTEAGSSYIDASALYFDVPGNTLTVNKTGSGTVTSAEGVINCGVTCSYAYRSGQVVTLTAAPAAGYVITGWTGATATGLTTATVDMTGGNKSVTATFALAGPQITAGVVDQNGNNPIRVGDTLLYTLTVRNPGNTQLTGLNLASLIPANTTYVSGSATTTQGAITQSPLGFSLASLDPGDTAIVTYAVTVNPSAAGSLITGNGDVTGDQISPTQHFALTASASAVYGYTLTFANIGNGTASASPAQPANGYANNASVSLTAAPAADSVFDHWAGGATGGSNPTTVVITGDTTVTAYFTPRTYIATPTVTITDEAGHSPFQVNDILDYSIVLKNDGNSDLTNLNLTSLIPPNTTYQAGTATVSSGTIVTAGQDLHATIPALVAGTNSTVTVSFKVSVNDGQQGLKLGGSAVLVANEISRQDIPLNPSNLWIQGYTITTHTSGTGTGTVSVSAPAGPAGYKVGEPVTLTAAEGANSFFSGWSGDVPANAPQNYPFNINKNMDVTAAFTARVYHLTSTTTVTDEAAHNPYQIGDTLAYSIVLTNDGNSDLTNLALSQVIPAGTHYVDGSATTTQGNATETPSFNLGTLAHGASATITYKVVVDAAAAGVTISGNGTITSTEISSQSVSLSAPNPVQGYTLTIPTSTHGSVAVSQAPGANGYTYNQALTLTATADSGYVFTGWSSDLTGDANPATITMDGSKNVTAIFEAQNADLHVTPVVSYPDGHTPNQVGDRVRFQLTLENAGNVDLTNINLSNLIPSGTSYQMDSGSIIPLGTRAGESPLSFHIDTLAPEGQTVVTYDVVIQAAAAGTQITGYGLASTTQGNHSIDLTVPVAVQGWTLTINHSNGSVSATPAQPAGGYTNNVVVTLTATADSGYLFNGWSGATPDAVDPAMATVTMNGNKTVSASFIARTYAMTSSVDVSNPAPQIGDTITYTITINNTGNSDLTNVAFSADPSLIPDYTTYVNGSGTMSINGGAPVSVSQPPAAITLPAGQSAVYTYSVLVGADAAARTIGGSTSVSSNELTAQSITLPSTTSPVPGYVLTINPQPLYGTIQVLDAPGPNGYTNGQVIHLSATPDTGYILTGWTGATPDGADPTLATVTMNGSQTVSATFILYNPKLKVETSVTDDNGGQIQINDLLHYQVILTNTGTITLNSVSLSDLVPTGATYRSGTASSGGVGSFTFGPLAYSTTNMASGASITLTYDVTVTGAPGSTLGGGTITTAVQPGDTVITNPAMPGSTIRGWFLTLNSTHGSIASDPVQPTYGYADGTTVNLTAAAADGYVFSSWTGATPDGVDPTKATVTMNGNKTATAAFMVEAPTLSAVTVVSNHDNHNPLQVGDQLDYTITLTNDGNVDLNNVTFADLIPAFSMYAQDSAMISVNSGSASSASMPPAAFTLPVGESATLTYSVLVTSDATGHTIGGSGSVSSSETSAQTIDLTASASPVLGFNLTTQTNGGTGSGSVNVLTAPGTNGYTNGQQVSVQAVPASDSIFVGWIGATPDSQDPTKATVTMTGYNQVVSAVFALKAPHLKVETTVTDANGAPIQKGDVLHYQVILTNDGNIALDTVSLSGLAPAGTVYKSGTAASGGVGSFAESPFTYSTTNMAPGAVITLTYDVTVTDDMGGTIGGPITVVTEPGGSQDVTPTIPDPTVKGWFLSLIHNNGTVIVSPEQPADGYSTNTVVTLTAAANSGYVFASWDGATPDTQNPANADVTMDANKTVTAVFVTASPHLKVETTVVDVNGSPLQKGDTLHYQVKLTNDGNVTLNNVSLSGLVPAGAVYQTGTAASGGVGTFTFDPLVYNTSGMAPGAVITLTYDVTVTGDMGGTIGGPITVITDPGGTQNVTPTIPDPTVKGWFLTLNHTNGAVSANPTQPADGYNNNTVVTLTATADSNYVFSSWTGATPDSADLTKATVTMDANKTVTAAFVLANPHLKVETTVTDANGSPLQKGDILHYQVKLTNDGNITLGTVALSGLVPNGAAYQTGTAASGGVGSFTYNPLAYNTSNMAPGAVIILTYDVIVTDDTGGTVGGPITVVTDPGGSQEVTPVIPNPTVTGYNLTINKAGSGSVAVSSNPAAGSDGTYPSGASIQLTATADAGYTFTGWSGDLTGAANPATLSMTSNKVITATFTKNQTPPQKTADLVVTATGMDFITPEIQIVVTVTNAGPDAVTGATVIETTEGLLETVSWTCTAAGGATCPASGSSALNETVDLPSGSSVTYTIHRHVSASPKYKDTITVQSPADVTDTNLANNTVIVRSPAIYLPMLYRN